MNRYFGNDRVYHLFIWLLLIIPRGIGTIYIAKNSMLLYAVNLLLQNSLLLCLIYLNLLYLIPKFYQPKRYRTYFFLLFSVVAIHISCTYFINDYISKFMNFGEENNDWRLEVLFYFFNTCQYLVISFLLYALQERFEQKKQLSEIQVEKLNTEVNYLKAQINPHFLFNTLNNLYALALDKSDKAPETILMLSKMMDYMLYETSESKVSLQKDIENLENYIGLERIRQGNEAKINFEVIGKVEEQKIVPLILLPLIENAFKHGIHQLIRGAFVHIWIAIEPKTVQLTVENNFKRSTTLNSHGIGLTNLKKRLELFYANKHELMINQEEGIYRVLLKLNVS